MTCSSLKQPVWWWNDNWRYCRQWIRLLSCTCMLTNHFPNRQSYKNELTSHFGKTYTKHTFLKSLYYVEYDGKAYYFMAKVTKRNTDNKNCRKKVNKMASSFLSYLYSYIVLVSKTLVSFCEIFLFYLFWVLFYKLELINSKVQNKSCCNDMLGAYANIP